MAGPGFSAEDVDRLRQKLTNELDPPLAEQELELLGVIFDAASAGAASSSQPPALTTVEVGNEELRQLLDQLVDAFTPGTSPGSITQINVFNIRPVGGGDGP